MLVMLVLVSGRQCEQQVAAGGEVTGDGSSRGGGRRGGVRAAEEGGQHEGVEPGGRLQPGSARAI
jgi:hypothetical protein